MPTLPLLSPAPGFGVSVLFLGAGKAGAVSSRSAWPVAFPTQSTWRLVAFYFSVDALLIEVRLAFLLVVVVPCIYFHCISVEIFLPLSFWWVRVCERAGEDAVEKIKKPVATDYMHKKLFVETVLADVV